MCPQCGHVLPPPHLSHREPPPFFRSVTTASSHYSSARSPPKPSPHSEHSPVLPGSTAAALAPFLQLCFSPAASSMPLRQARLLPRGLCTYPSLYLTALPSDLLAHSLTSSWSLLKCHFLREIAPASSTPQEPHLLSPASSLSQIYSHLASPSISCVVWFIRTRISTSLLTAVSAGPRTALAPGGCPVCIHPGNGTRKAFALTQSRGTQ